MVIGLSPLKSVIHHTGDDINRITTQQESDFFTMSMITN